MHELPPEARGYHHPPSEIELRPDARGYYHPCSERQICALVRHARSAGMQVRVCGAAHSVPGAIHADRRLLPDAGETKPAMEMLLDRYAGVTFDDERMTVTVQAGCRFGADPRDRTGTASLEAGLCSQLDRRGWALPILGGITHPTVVGFLAIGSSGASASRSLHDQVVAMRLIDEGGDVRDLSRDDGDVFDAALVSLGLLGIVSTVTLACVERFDVIGSEEVFAIHRAPFAVEGKGKGSLETFLRDTPFARVLWWPQAGVDRLVVWQARPMDPTDYDGETGPPWALNPRPHEPFERVLGSGLPRQALAGAALTFLGGWRDALPRVMGHVAGAAMLDLAESLGARRVETGLIRRFVGEQGARRFWDAWYRALPMDDGIDERLLPTTFTEIFVPLSATGEAMRRLRDLYRRDPDAAGSFVVEIYAAAPSRAWLAPCHGEPMLRLNFFWLERNPGDPREGYFPRFWALFEDLEPRLHWAKLLPLDAERTASALARRYPRWHDFLALRARFDPEGLFCTRYWRAHLGIEGEAPFAPLPSAMRPAAVATDKWPTPWTMAPSGKGFVDHADHVFDLHGYVPAPPTEVHRVVAEMIDTHLWVPGYVRTDWITPPGAVEGAVLEEVFRFMTIRLRVVETVPGRRWAASALACTHPLGERMGICVDFAPAPDGGTDVRWRVGFDRVAATKLVEPLILPFFEGLFRESLAGLARHLGRAPRASSPVVRGA